MAAGFIEFIGGKLGRYAQVGTQRYWTPLRVLLMFAVIFLGLAYLSKAYCLESVLPGAGLSGAGSAGSSGGAGATTGAGEALLNWSGNRQYTAACYSDTIAGYTQFSHNFPYNVPVADAPKSPVLSTLFGWIMYWISAMVGVVVRLVGLQIAPPVVYFAVTAVTLSILWMITVRIMVDLTGSRVWDTLLLTCSPVVIVHAFTHWEILSITTVVGALWCLSRQHFGYAGVFIGLGISAQIWPVFLLLALYIIAGRNDQWWETLRCTEFTILSWAAINIPVAVLFPHTWFRYFVDVYLQMWDWQSGFALLIRETNWLGFDRATTLNLVTVGMFSVLLVMIIAVIAQSPSTPGVPEVTLLLLVAWLLSTKEWSSQFSLWLVPIIVLAVPKWRLVFAWGAVEAVLWYVQALHMLGKDHLGLPGGMLDFMLIIRGGLLLMLVWVMLRDNIPHIPKTRRRAYRKHTWTAPQSPQWEASLWDFSASADRSPATCTTSRRSSPGDSSP